MILSKNQYKKYKDVYANIHLTNIFLFAYYGPGTELSVRNEQHQTLLFILLHLILCVLWEGSKKAK